MGLLPPIGAKSAKFETPGDTVSGTLLEIGDEQQARKYSPTGDGGPDFWDDEKTRPKMQRKFVVQSTPDPVDPEDDGVRNIWAVVAGKPGGLYAAINDAVKNATALGGTLTVVFTGTDPQSKNPANPRKLYAASYTDPTPGQLLGGAAPAAAAPAAQQPAAATPPPAAPAAPAGVQRPHTITEAAWAAMDAATQAAVAGAQQPQQQSAEPPF